MYVRTYGLCGLGGLSGLCRQYLFRAHEPLTPPETPRPAGQYVCVCVYVRLYLCMFVYMSGISGGLGNLHGLGTLEHLDHSDHFDHLVHLGQLDHLGHMDCMYIGR